MDTKHRGIQLFGWLAIFSGCALLARILISARIANIWMLVGDALFAGFAAYFIYIGRRAVFAAKGQPRPRSRFGWGRMLLGAFLIFSAANTRFHLFPTRTVVKPLEYSNPTQAAAGNIVTIAICIGCFFLIISGIRKGFQDSKAQG